MATYIEITPPSTGAYTVFGPPIGRIEITPPLTGAYTVFGFSKSSTITVGMVLGKKRGLYFSG